MSHQIVTKKLFYSLLLFNTILSAMEYDQNDQRKEQSISLVLLKRQILSQSNTFVDDAKRQQIIAPGCFQKKDDFRIGVFDYNGKFKTGLEGHTNWVTDIESMPGNPDILVSCGSDGNTIGWDLTTGKSLGVGKDDQATLWKVLGLGKDNQGRYLMVSGGGDKADKPRIAIWNAQNGNLIATCVNGHDWTVTAIAKPENQQWFVTGQVDGGIVCVWDFTGTRLAQLPVTHQSSLFNALKVLEHPTLGAFIVTGSDKIKFWSLAQGKVKEIKNDQVWVTAIAFSDDKKQMVTGGRDGKLILYDLKSITDCTQVKDIWWHEQQINDVRILQDKGVILSVSGVPLMSTDTSIRVYDLNANPINMLELESGSNMLTCVQPIGPNKNLFAIGDEIGIFSLVQMDGASYTIKENKREHVHQEKNEEIIEINEQNPRLLLFQKWMEKIKAFA